MLRDINFLRFPKDFDYSKVPIIRNDKNLTLPPKPQIDNWIDRIRINNKMKVQLPYRQVPEVDLLEQEREEKFGQRVDVNSSTLYNTFKNQTFNLPVFNPDGTMVLKDTGQLPARPVMRNYNIQQVLSDPNLTLFRMRQLSGTLEDIPNQLIQIRDAVNVGGVMNDQQMNELRLLMANALQNIASISTTGQLVITNNYIQNVQNTIAKIVKNNKIKEKPNYQQILLDEIQNNPIMISKGELDPVNPNYREELLIYLCTRFQNNRKKLIPDYINYVVREKKDDQQFDFLKSITEFIQKTSTKIVGEKEYKEGIIGQSQLQNIPLPVDHEFKSAKKEFDDSGVLPFPGDSLIDSDYLNINKVAATNNKKQFLKDLLNNYILTKKNYYYDTFRLPNDEIKEAENVLMTATGILNKIENRQADLYIINDNLYGTALRKPYDENDSRFSGFVNGREVFRNYKLSFPDRGTIDKKYITIYCIGQDNNDGILGRNPNSRVNNLKKIIKLYVVPKVKKDYPNVYGDEEDDQVVNTIYNQIMSESAIIQIEKASDGSYFNLNRITYQTLGY